MVKKGWKNKALAVVFSVMLAGLTGCSVDTGTASSAGETKIAEEADGEETADGTENTEETKETEGSKETLTVMIGSGDGGGEAAKTAFQKAADIMGINVELSIFPDDQFLNVLNTKGATGNLDDLIFVAYSLPDLPYNELAELDGDWVNNVTDVSRQFLLNPDDGQTVIMAPMGAESNMGLAYNKKVLADAGVELPIRDYGSFMDACEKIKATGVTPVYVSAKETWTPQILLLSSMTSTIMKEDGLAQKLATNQVKPQDIQGLQDMWANVAALKEKGYINEDHMSATHDMGKKAIAEGSAGFYAVTDAAYGEIQSEYPDLVDGVGLTITPMWNDAELAFVMTNRTSRTLAVSKKSKNLELAKEFVNTCLSEEVLKVYYELSPGAAPFQSLDYELTTSPWNAEMQELAKEMPSYGDWANALFDGKAVLNPFWGDFDLNVQSMFSGKSSQEAIEGWYKKYADDAKAKRLEGF